MLKVSYIFRVDLTHPFLPFSDEQWNYIFSNQHQMNMMIRRQEQAVGMLCMMIEEKVENKKRGLCCFTR